MRIAEVTPHNFMGVRAPQTLVLPEQGLVLVTGANGHAKTTFLRAVAFALWGEGVSGHPCVLDPKRPQKGGRPGGASVLAHGARAPVARSYDKAGKRRLAFEGSEKYETLTKAQEALERGVGTFEVWRRTCVFTSDDVVRFTDATDADRKRFLERVTDPDGRLEAASQKCREDLRRAAAEIAAKRGELRVLEGAAQSLLSQMREARAEVAATSPDGGRGAVFLRELLASARAGLQQHAEGVEKRTQHIAGIEQARRAARDARVQAERDAEHAAHHAELLSGAACPTCERPISGEEAGGWKRGALEEIERQRAVAERAAADERKLDEALAEARRQLAAKNESIAAIRSDAEELRAELARAEDRERERDRRAAKLRRLATECEDAHDEADGLRIEVEQLASDEVVLALADAVLGTRGFRSYLLEDVLRRIEQDANDWLLRLSGGHDPMSVELRPQSEKARGGVSDVISFRVDYGGGSFDSISRGERRRVDVAVTFALAALRTEGTSERSTLWLDEVADGLDESGVEAMAGVLEDIAERQPVVVVSHDDRLVRLLSCAARYEVVRGELFRRA